MKRKSCFAMFSVMLFAVMLAAAPDSPEQDWTHFARIAAYNLQANNADQIIRNARDSNVFGIEVDNDIPGRYESFLHPEEKLAAIRAVAERAHKAGNHAFVYIAGLECITANAGQSPHSVAKDHPEWLQRKITGEPAIFGGGTAFWIAKGDEDSVVCFGEAFALAVECVSVEEPGEGIEITASREFVLAKMSFVGVSHGDDDLVGYSRAGFGRESKDKIRPTPIRSGDPHQCRHRAFVVARDGSTLFAQGLVM